MIFKKFLNCLKIFSFFKKINVIVVVENVSLIDSVFQKKRNKLFILYIVIFYENGRFLDSLVKRYWMFIMEIFLINMFFQKGVYSIGKDGF